MVALLLFSSLAAAETAEELIVRMRSAWDGLSSYRTGQIIQERVRGSLGPEQRVRVAFRKPWEIQLEWETVHAGRKVYWCACRHDGDVRVDPGGLAGAAVGILSLALDSSLIKRDTNYSPREGGFGYLVETVSNSLRASPRPTATEPLQTQVNGERAWTIALSNVRHPRYARAELVLSQKTGLPLSFTAWSAEGELAERYAWFDTVVNPTLADTTDFSAGYR